MRELSFKRWAAIFTLTGALGAGLTAADMDDTEAEVDLSGGATATALPTEVPTLLPTIVPTAAPTSAPTVAPTPAASPAPDPEAGHEDLKKVTFDKKAKPDASEDGLVIIAPGSASPEDSLESFGIESPFDWKGKDRKPMAEPGKEGEEALELTAPESSDLKERVSVETSSGTVLNNESDYDLVERSGAIVSASEYRADGRLVRAKGGQFFSKKGNLILIKMEAGRQVYPGTLFTTFRDHGLVRTHASDPVELGALVMPTGVVRVTRLEGEEVQARVEKQYTDIQEGDWVRLRDPEKQRYYASMRQGPSTVSAELAGEIAAIAPPNLTAAKGSMVYLSVGRSKGLVPGLRLSVHRPSALLLAEGQRPVEDTGRVGLIEVVAVGRHTATARVLKAGGGLRAGDLLRYR